ncbi:MAG: helix-turn-helix domain-containing protein [Quadrisphaera sp.]
MVHELAPSSQRWRDLLQVLKAQLDEVAGDWLAVIDRGHRFYEEIPEVDDLEASGRKAFRYLLGRLLEEELPADLERFPMDIGALRARQGVQPSQLAAAVRADFVVLWQRLRAQAGDDDDQVLIEHVAHLWHAVNDLAVLVESGYMDEKLRQARSAFQDQQQALADVFTSPSLSDKGLRRAAGHLGLSLDQAFWVVGSSEPDDVEQVQRRLRGRSAPSWVFTDREVTFGLLPATGRWRSDEDVVDDLMLGATGAVSPHPVRLERVHHAGGVVRMLVQGSRDADEAVTLRRGWSSLSLDQLAGLVGDLRAYVVEPVRALADGEQVLLTVREYCRTGSVLETASNLYCHRNTVLNRMRRFEEQTGIDMRTPRATALVQMSLLPG